MDSNLEMNLLRFFNGVNRNVNELMWSEVFHDSINGCKWLSKDEFSINPGRSAVGYNYFYVVFRILNEVQPKSILELGPGQSSKLIAQYIKTRKNLKDYIHLMVEHNETFVKILENNFQLSSASRMNLINLERIRFEVNGGGGIL
ncbi:MAG: hypothetical protein IJ728_09060 [Selenomonadaceae bacterium]|nr:hypothetical protein [Selenomonadaceae bacterium]